MKAKLQPLSEVDSWGVSKWMTGPGDLLQVRGWCGEGVRAGAQVSPWLTGEV